MMYHVIHCGIVHTYPKGKNGEEEAKEERAGRKKG